MLRHGPVSRADANPLALQYFEFVVDSSLAITSRGVAPMKHVNSRQSAQILWIAMISLSAAPVHAYTTPCTHAPEFDGGWGSDPSTWSDPNEWQRQTALTGGWGCS